VLREGADIIVAQGTEAGGHGGGRSTLPLVPAVVDMVAGSGRSVPVVAAGGITDRRGLAAALMLGADGVLMGTRFYVASESLVAPGAQARVIAASGDETLRTTIFDIARGYTWPKVYTGRAVRNRFSEAWHGREDALARDEVERARYAERQRGVTGKALLLADAVGLALFALSGAQVAEAAQCPAIIVVLMGTMTGVAGGVLRDVITAQVPLILRRDIYATAAIVGVALYLLLQAFGFQRSAVFGAGMAVVIALRLLAIHWGLQLPIFRMPE